MRKLWMLFKQNLFTDFYGWTASQPRGYWGQYPTNMQASGSPPLRTPWATAKTTIQVQPLSLQVTQIYDPVAAFVFKKHDTTTLTQLWCGTLYNLHTATNMLMRISSHCITLSIPMWLAVFWISHNACNERW